MASSRVPVPRGFGRHHRFSWSVRHLDLRGFSRRHEIHQALRAAGVTADQPALVEVAVHYHHLSAIRAFRWIEDGLGGLGQVAPNVVDFAEVDDRPPEPRPGEPGWDQFSEAVGPLGRVDWLLGDVTDEYTLDSVITWAGRILHRASERRGAMGLADVDDGARSGPLM